jgi:hypothetical protein
MFACAVVALEGVDAAAGAVGDMVDALACGGVALGFTADGVVALGIA